MYVFLSYGRSDEPLARELRARLSAAGLDVWDVNREVLPGDNWARAAASALEQADAMVVLISPASLESQSVRREIEYALGSERFEGRLVPVVVRRGAHLPWILRTLRQVELRNNPTKASREIVEILRQADDSATSTGRAPAH
jgi:hypothetical protein